MGKISHLEDSQNLPFGLQRVMSRIQLQPVSRSYQSQGHKHQPMLRLDAVGQRECCAVCLQTVDNCPDIKSLSCKHKFHKNCIAKWLAIRESCPLCRAKQQQPTSSLYPRWEPSGVKKPKPSMPTSSSSAWGSVSIAPSPLDILPEHPPKPTQGASQLCGFSAGIGVSTSTSSSKLCGKGEAQDNYDDFDLSLPSCTKGPSSTYVGSVSTLTSTKASVPSGPPKKSGKVEAIATPLFGSWGLGSLFFASSPFPAPILPTPTKPTRQPSFTFDMNTSPPESVMEDISKPGVSREVSFDLSLSPPSLKRMCSQKGAGGDEKIVDDGGRNNNMDIDTFNDFEFKESSPNFEFKESKDSGGGGGTLDSDFITSTGDPNTFAAEKKTELLWGVEDFFK
eukprot:25075-Amorphochlora_amoeboformis.AAC.2